MSILDRAALERSPLADLHAIASELSLDGYRRLRKPELIEAIIAHQKSDGAGDLAGEQTQADGDAAAGTVEPPAGGLGEEPVGGRRRRGRRGGRGRTAEDEAAEEKASPRRRRRPADEGKPSSSSAPEGAPAPESAGAPAGELVAEGVVEVLANGSAFLRVRPPEPSDEDIYISAAQVKRCELISGDRITGPRRTPRRSERFASLVRVDAINGRPASEVVDSARFDDLPAGFAVDRLRLGSEDPTLKAIEFLTPFGRGSRVTIAGPPQAGKTEVLRRLAEVLATIEDVHLALVLAGVRPEEVAEWENGPVAPAAAVNTTAPTDTQAQAVERAVDQTCRLTARGKHAVVLIDTLAGLAHGPARRALGCARRIVDGGSLTVIATAQEPVGGETTLITLDGALTAARRFPALDLAASWTMRPELLVGDEGTELILRTRAEALDR